MFWIVEQLFNIIWQIVIKGIEIVTSTLYSNFSLNIDENYFHSFVDGSDTIEVTEVVAMVGTAFGKFIQTITAVSIGVIIVYAVIKLIIVMISNKSQGENAISILKGTVIALFLAFSMHTILQGAFYIGDQALGIFNGIELKGQSNAQIINEEVFSDLKLEGFNDKEEDKGIIGDVVDGVLKATGIQALLMVILRLFLFIPILIELIKLGAEVIERWINLFLIYATASAPCIALVSENSKHVFYNWTRMVFSQIILVITNVIFLKIALFLLKYPAFGQNIAGVLMFGFMTFGVLRAAQNIDMFLMTIGLNSAQSGTIFSSSVGGLLSNMGSNVMSMGAGALATGAGKTISSIGNYMTGEGRGQATGLSTEFGGSVNTKNASINEGGKVNTNTARAMAQATPDVKGTGFVLEGKNALDAIQKSGLPGASDIDPKKVDYNNTSFRNGIAQIGYKDGSSQIIQGLGEGSQGNAQGTVKETSDGRSYNVSGSKGTNGLTEAQKTSYGYNSINSLLEKSANSMGEYRDSNGNKINYGKEKGTVSLSSDGVYSLYNPNDKTTEYYASTALGEFEGGSIVEINGNEFSTITTTDEIPEGTYPKVQSDIPEERVNNFAGNNYSCFTTPVFKDQEITDVNFVKDNVKQGLGRFDITTDKGETYEAYSSAHYGHGKSTKIESTFENKFGESFFVVSKASADNNISRKETSGATFIKKDEKI